MERSSIFTLSFRRHCSIHDIAVEDISPKFRIGATAETGEQGEPSSGQIPPSGGQSALNDAATASVGSGGPAGGATVF